MAFKAYAIFDLDQTLADTMHLAQARQDGDWESVRRQIPEVRLYEGVGDLLAQVRDAGYRIGVVTNSPRWYCDQIFEVCQFTPHSIVCSGEVESPKPNPAGIRLVLARLAGYSGRLDPGSVQRFIRENRINNTAVYIGDSWADVLAAKACYIDSLAVTWGASNHHELESSNPFYICDTVPELANLLSTLRSTSWPLATGVAAATDRYEKSLWRRGDNSDGRRSNLRREAEFFSARDRWQGNWTTSCGNNLVGNLKIPLDATSRIWAKDQAVERFAKELAILLPRHSVVTFIWSSKLPGHPKYDDRFDRVIGRLTTIRPDVQIVRPILPRSSVDAAHESDDFNMRLPEVIMENLIWEGGLPETSSLYIIDDVLTSGGHFEAYLRMLDSNGAGVRGVGVFWSLHHSEARPALA